MKPDNKAMKAVPFMQEHKQMVLNDIAFRLVLIPAFGIAIPYFTNMVTDAELSQWHLKFGYLYTIGIALIIWEGNRYLLFTLRSYFNWMNHPVKKIAALLLAISFFTIPVSIGLLRGWYYLFNNDNVSWEMIKICTLIIMICVLFITHVYETVFLVKDSENEMIKNSLLQKANAESELKALKNQIDPHFLFNSLNTMSALIEDSPVKAKIFNDQLADVYRYILDNKSRNLVVLEEELYFLQEYFYLLKIRYGKAVELCAGIETATAQSYVIPPVSLQILLENVFKHNDFSQADPLIIEIDIEGTSVAVKNKLNRKKGQRASGTGLLSLNERYQLITGKSIEILETPGYFKVGLPLLNIYG